jgi:hypothetical protein
MDFEKLKEYFVDTMILTTTCIDKRKIFTRTQKIVDRVTKILCENIKKEFGR